ncbi:MAG: hypothetical protein ACI8U4_002010 [Natronomonas sp.]|jgi:hypothetical protein
MAHRNRGEAVLLAGYAVFETVRGAVPELLAVLATIAINLGIDEPLLGAALNGGFFAVTFYVFAPVVFPAHQGERRERPGFRVVVAAVSLAFALPASLALTTFEALSPTFALLLGYLAAATLAGMVTFGLYFRVTQSVPLFDPTGDAFALLQSRADESVAEYQEHLERLEADHPYAAGFTRRLSVVASLGAFVVPCILFGIAAAALDSFFPLLETFVLAGLVIQAGSRLGVAERRLPDVETQFYNRLTAATRSTRGVAGVMMALVSVIFAAFLVALWVAVGGLWFGSVTNSLSAFERFVGWYLEGRIGAAMVGQQFLRIVASVGGILAIPLSSGYVTWYWYRELRRLAASEQDETGTIDTARPPGFLLPAIVLVGGWFVYSTGASDPWPVDEAFAVAWPCVGLVMLWTVHRTRRNTAGTTDDTNWSIPLGYLLYGGTVAGVLIAFADFPRQFALAIAALPWLFYLGMVTDYAGDLFGRVLLVGYALGPLLLIVVLRDVFNIGPPLLALFGGIVGLIVLGQVLTHVYEDGFEESDA